MLFMKLYKCTDSCIDSVSTPVAHHQLEISRVSSWYSFWLVNCFVCLLFLKQLGSHIFTKMIMLSVVLKCVILDETPYTVIFVLNLNPENFNSLFLL